MRYTSDLTDAEWQLIDYCFPEPCKTRRPREHSYRELLNAIFGLKGFRKAPGSRRLLFWGRVH
jgi:hypothetical protein